MDRLSIHATCFYLGEKAANLADHWGLRELSNTLDSRFRAGCGTESNPKFGVIKVRGQCRICSREDRPIRDRDGRLRLGGVHVGRLGLTWLAEPEIGLEEGVLR